MDYNEMFKPILDEGEIILKTYKPNRSRIWANAILIIACLSIFFIPIMMGVNFPMTSWWGFGASIGLYCIAVICTILFNILWAKKTVYAVTNKRILIRTGFIGVDYKSLDHTMLAALAVNVSWVDKLMRSKTGSISFGSMASPMVNNGAKFIFAYIQNPYEEYKEIKQIIDKHQSK